MDSVFRNYFGNAGSRTHSFGQNANKIVEASREKIAKLLSASKQEVVFTSGATESNNIAILGLAKWGKENNRNHIISTNMEHKSILEPLEQLKKQGFDIDIISENNNGRIEQKQIENKIRPETLMVSIAHANNETGVIQPVIEIGESLKDTDVYFHIDAAQTYGKLVNDLKKTSYDLLSISGHKIYAPQGIGALLLRRKNYKRPPVKPITFGGEQEKGLRPGTLPVALIAGLGKISELATEEHPKWIKHLQKTKGYILKQLERVEFEINGNIDHMLPNTLNISFPGVDSEALMLALHNEIGVSNGSACTSNSFKPSHVLQAMKLPEGRINSSIRVSWGPETNEPSLEPLLNSLNLIK